MKKRVSLIFISICLLIIFSGCEKKDNEGDKSNMLKGNIPYSVRMNISFAIRSAAIEKEYGKADAVRDLDIKSYEVRNMDDDSTLFVIYDKETNRAIDIWRLKKLFSRDSFNGITEGQSTFADITSIDPYAAIIEKTKDNGISEHKLVNNGVMVISYIKKKDAWVVDKLSYTDNDPSEFAKTLTKDDLQLIS